MGIRERLSGNEAVAYAMKQINPDVMGAYPITPSTEIPQYFSTYVDNGEVDTLFIAVESEHSAMSTCIGAEAAGCRAISATSSCGLCYMTEMMYVAASCRLPITLACVNRALSGPININNDHSDAMGVRDAGWLMLFAETNQEAYDNYLQAMRIAEAVSLPIMVCQDGFITSHALENIVLLDTDSVKQFVGEYHPEHYLLKEANPLAVGPYDLGCHYMEHKVQQAEAQFNNAEREWKRIRPLYEKNAVSQKERDSARAAYESAKAELRQAKINLDYCQVTAPVSGYSSKENFTPGNLVGNNSLLTYVNQTDPMYIDFSIAAPERMRRQQLAAAGRLRFPENGRYKARLRLLDGTLYKGEGEVTFIDSQVQPSTGVIKARAVFANADGHIMPGQYVRLYMEGDVLKNAVLIPQKCVVLTQKGSLVMGLDKDNKVYAIPVTLSVAVGDRYLVDSGLKGGERIISEGLVKARPGTQVRVQEPAAQQQQAQAPAAQK